ncbi:MAG: CoA-binding protein [Dehalococcoidia bacterium]|nr:MAG: CoA-binding protein [Dehalococcoidia bacterium]
MNGGKQELGERSVAQEGGPLAIDYIFHPRSVAIVGPSPQLGLAGMGAAFVLALQDIGFEGGLYPVNPRHENVLGLKCYPSLLDIPGPVDHVIFSVPVRAVLDVVEDCVTKGVKSMHFFTAGFSETGEKEGAELERQMVQRAREAGIRVIGPNCIGLYCPAAKVSFGPGSPKTSGPVAFLSQSGGNAADLLTTASPRGIRFSKIISYGNAADLNECDFLEYLTEDPDTKIIAAYIEGVKDGRRFFRAMRKASARKPVIVLKGGRTESGSRAVFSHTASLAGSQAVFNALVRQVGAVAVDSMEEMVDMLIAFRFIESPPAGRGVGIVGGGGGFSVFAADEVDEAGLTAPALSQRAQEELRRFTPVAGSSVRNPVDTLAVMEPAKLVDTLRIVAAEETVHVILGHTGFGWGPGRVATAMGFDLTKLMEAVVDAMERAREIAKKPIALVVATPPILEPTEHSLRFQELCWRRGFAAFPSIPRAANAIAKMVAWREMREDLSR